MKVAVIGAGLAGVEAAIAARKAGASVTIFSGEAVAPYLRPRLPDAAFAGIDVAKLALHPEAWYSANGITLKLDTPVTEIDGDGLVVTTIDGSEEFDSMVLACGASPIKPILPGAVASPRVLTLWSASDVARIKSQLKKNMQVVIIGGGILGTEAALRAAAAGMKVTIVEKAKRLMAGQFDEAPSKVILAKLNECKVDVKLGTTVERAEKTAKGLKLFLAGSDETIETGLVLFAIGARPNINLAREAGFAVDRGIVVDETLQTSYPQVYAAGDCVQFGVSVRCSARGAILQGRVAGINAVASARGANPVKCPSDEMPLFFKSPELELHACGQTSEVCLGAKAKRIDNGRKAGVIKVSVVRPDGAKVGIQMVGTNEGFDAEVKELAVNE